VRCLVGHLGVEGSACIRHSLPCQIGNHSFLRTLTKSKTKRPELPGKASPIEDFGDQITKVRSNCNPRKGQGENGDQISGHGNSKGLRDPSRRNRMVSEWATYGHD
jgi:hypothetical protein